MKKMISAIVCMLALVLCLTACGQSVAAPTGGVSLADGGVLVLSVNPEIAVEYDENGTVTGVTARNDDALAIIASCEGLIGQPTRNVVTDLVTAIGEAGYFVEEVEGEGRQITLEIEPGSSLPSEAFLNEVIEGIRICISTNDWTTPVVVEGESDYGMSDYVDTDYGVGNDGFTDYDDTDYGPDNDGVTDYDGTDYADNTDYGVNADGVTDYTDYGATGSGSTGNTNYGDSAYGDSGYEAPAATNPPASSGNTDYGDSSYDDGSSNYDDGDSNYDDGDSEYDD